MITQHSGGVQSKVCEQGAEGKDVFIGLLQLITGGVQKHGKKTKVLTFA